ncbi:MAG TPA: riboflavin synthase [Campylobacterales bacterium]|nr:riboflavin synthase [Campylobacterales bacterium]
MFTGLIREFATVKSFNGEKLSLKSSYKPKIGDSIAINGACLTVTEVAWGGFGVELSHESQKILATENLRGRVHMEPAMQMGDRFEGHVVQGHIDCVGEIVRIDRSSNGYDYYIKVPKEFIALLPPKGSVTCDGVSLTINETLDESFRLTVIPHTLQTTLFGDYKVGRRINVETDMFARYLAHIFRKKNSLSWDEIDKMQALY